MPKMKDVVEEAEVPGVGEVDMTSLSGPGKLFVGMLGLFATAGAAGWAFNQLKSLTGADEVTSPLGGVLGDL